MKSFYITTFGCQMNVHDSEKIAGVLKQKGYSPAENPKSADLVIFNTCSIREKAEQKFFSELGRLKTLKKRKDALKIVVAGCVAQQKGDELFKKAPHIDFIMGPQNIHMLTGMLDTDGKKVFTDDNPEIADYDIPASRNSGLKAWVSIMYGCNNFCSYCIVPYTRGRERSRPSRHILDEVLSLSEKGIKEITLLGQNVNSYRSDTDFPGLLGKLNGIRGIERIRFVTSHPRDLSDNLIVAIKELDKICEHIHLPLQSGSDSVLKLMNRGYSYVNYRKKVEGLREKIPGVSITSDIIAGFPGETDNDHMATVNALNEIRFDGIFAFNFSPRQGTGAAEMSDQIPDDIKSGRLNEILRLQDTITFENNRALKGTVQEILVEGTSEKNRDKLTGRTRANKIVNFKGDDSLIGRLIDVEIIETRRHSLDGMQVSL